MRCLMCCLIARTHSTSTHVTLVCFLPEHNFAEFDGLEERG